MSRTLVAATAALATAAATVLVAPAADAAGRGVTHVHATKKHTVVAPASLRPGLVHLRNDGSQPLLLVRKKHEGSAQLVTYLNAKKDSVSNRIFTRFGFVEVVARHADDYLTLTRGTYYLVAAGGKKATLGNVRSVVVKGRTANVRRPAYRSLRITSKGVVSGASTGGARPVLRLRTGARPVVLGTLPLKASATDAQVREALADKTGEKLFEIIDGSRPPRFNEFLGAHRDVTVRTTLGRGRYLITAFPVTGNATGAGFLDHPHLLTLR